MIIQPSYRTGMGNNPTRPNAEAGCTIQSIRALQNHIDTRGPEELRDALELIVKHLRAGHSIEITPKVVYIDQHNEELDDDIMLGLEYEYLAPPWSGGLVPVVTERQFRRFVAIWKLNDTNSTYGEVRVVPARFTQTELVHIRNDAPYEDDWDRFPQFGQTDTGEPLYKIDGWTFTTGEWAK